eukprot:jgi/Ulvmu1/11975/UM082_0054.1
MSAKDVMAAFLSALVSATEAYALDRLNTCIAAPGFQEACSDGLLDHCQVTDPKGNVSRPLELAARRGFTAVVSELLQLGASPALQAKAFTGNTPLHMAVLHGDATMTAQMLKSLAASGGDVDIPNNNGDTALMFAMHRSAQDPSSPSSPIVHLLSAGASITATNRSGLSALMIACTSPTDILWKMLLRFTEEQDVREALARADVHGNAALHLAARAGCAAVCESLIAHGASPFAVNKANESPLDVAKEAGNDAAAAAVRTARRAAIEDAETAAAQLIKEALAERAAARDAARGDRGDRSSVGLTADSAGEARGSMLAAKSDTVITVPVDPRSRDGSQSLSSYESGMYDSPDVGDSTARGAESGSLSVPVDPRALDAPPHPEYPGHIGGDKAPSGSTALTAQPVGDVLFDVASVANFDAPGQSMAGGRLNDAISEAYTTHDDESGSGEEWDDDDDDEDEERSRAGDSAELEGPGPVEGRVAHVRRGSGGAGVVVKEGGVVKNGREGRGRAPAGQRQLTRHGSRGSSRGSAKRGASRSAAGPSGGPWPRPATVLRAAVPASSPAKAAAPRAAAGAAPPLPAQVRPGQGAVLSGYWVRNSKGAGGGTAGVAGAGEQSANVPPLKSGGRGRGGWTKGEAIQFLMEGPIVRPRHRSPPLSARNRGLFGQGRVHAEPAAHSIAQHLQQQLGKAVGDGERSVRRPGDATPGSKPSSPPGVGSRGGAVDRKAGTSHHPTPSQYADINNLISNCDTADISAALTSAHRHTIASGSAAATAAATAAAAARREPSNGSRPASTSDVTLPLWKLTSQQTRARANLSPRPHTARAATETPRSRQGSPSHAAEEAKSPSSHSAAASAPALQQPNGRAAGGARDARAMISCLGPVPLASHPLLSPRLASGPHSGGGGTPATSKRASPLSQGGRAREPPTSAAEHSTGSSPASSQGSTGGSQGRRCVPQAPTEFPDVASSARPRGATGRGACDGGGAVNPQRAGSGSSTGSEGAVEQRRGAGSKAAQHSAHSSVPLSASCSLGTAEKGRHVFQRTGVIEPGSDGGAATAEGGFGDGLQQGARALSDLGRLGSRSDEHLLSSSSSMRAREPAATARAPREGWHTGGHEGPRRMAQSRAQQAAKAPKTPVATPEFTKATDLGVKVHQLLGTDLEELSVAQLDAIEDWHYAQLQRLALAKLTAHRSMLRAKQTDLEALNAEIVGSPGPARAGPHAQ